MTAGELRQLYEKLYFQEVEARDKIHGRLQLSLTLLLVEGGAVVFLLQNIDYQAGAWAPLRVFFMLFFCAGIVLLVIAAGFFVKAFRNPRYRFLPDSEQTARYKATLDQTYEAYDQRAQLVWDAMDSYVTGYYVECGAFNTKVNDRRSAYLHSCNGAVVVAAVALMLAFLGFHFGNLDRGRMNPPADLRIIQPAGAWTSEKGK